MNYFLLFLELFIYGFAVFITIRKKELAIIYLPVLFFANTVIGEHAVSAFVYYGIITAMLAFILFKNTSFIKSNLIACFLIIYFFVLMGKAGNLPLIRQELFNVMWLFFCIPVIPVVYRKYSREQIMKELGRSACLILIIFILNTGLASLTGFNVYSMYGITSGVLYGHMFATDFNILAMAVFVLFLRALSVKNVFYLAVGIGALALLSLTLRRSVIGLAVLGVGIAMLLFFIQNIKAALVLGVAMMAGVVVIAGRTNFITSFNDRYELRKLDERSLDEEKRLFEYRMLYDDMFVHHRYSAWFGFGLFNSPGNYGDGSFYDRTLHSDVTSIAHSGGLVALGLYMMMFAFAFATAIRRSTGRTDNLIIFFCAVAFVTFTLTGRYTQVGCMLLLMLALQIPSALHEYQTETEDDLEEIADQGSLLVT